MKVVHCAWGVRQSLEHACQLWASSVAIAAVHLDSLVKRDQMWRWWAFNQLVSFDNLVVAPAGVAPPTAYPVTAVGCNRVWVALSTSCARDTDGGVLCAAEVL